MPETQKVEPRAADAKRIPQLDGLRGIAMLAVFLQHAFTLPFLWISMDLFLLISGFFITGSLLGDRHRGIGEYFSRFYERRTKRILPAYIVYLLVATLILGTGWTHLWYFYLGLMNFLLAFGLAYPEPMGTLWSLGLEEQFYCFWPLVVYFFRGKKLIYFGLGLIVLAPLLRGLCTAFLHTPWQAIYALTPFRMDDLAAGALIYLLWQKHSDKVQKYGYLGLIPAGIALTIMMILHHLLARRGVPFSRSAGNVVTHVWLYEIFVVTVCGVMFWALGGKGIGILKLRIFAWFGRISYSMYMIHPLIFFFLRQRMNNSLLICLLSFVATIAYAAPMWYLVERPIQRFGVKPKPVPAKPVPIMLS